MPTPWLNIDAILTKVHDLLCQDVRTMEIQWSNGRRILHEAQRFPAGCVYLGPATVVPETMPAGEMVRMRVIAEVATNAFEDKVAEVRLRGYLDQVAKVLVDNWELGLDYAYPVGLLWDPFLNEEAAPAYARARLFLDVEIRPT